MDNQEKLQLLKEIEEMEMEANLKRWWIDLIEGQVGNNIKKAPN